MRPLLLVTLFVLAACSGGGDEPAAPAAPAEAAIPVYGYEIVAAFPHDPAAYTQGLFWLDGSLYESTGLEGQSSIRKVDLATGQVLQRRDIPAPYFGEGIVAWEDNLVSLTWQNGQGFVFDLATFEPEGGFTYAGEGWGLTHDGQRLIMSDGSSQLRLLDPATLSENGRIAVTMSGRPVDKLNELEWVKGEIWANVFETDRIVRIDPASGNVVGTIYLGGLLSKADAAGAKPEVLNGIAWDAASDRIFVTGKLWPKLYEIRLKAPAT
jgi:glutaminyl-peptide cyclotransferase